MSQYQNTKFPGVRTREHATRKHGIKSDRYFLIRYQAEGKRKEEGLVVLTETKSGKDRVVPMTGAVHAMFEERSRSCGDGIVF